MAFPPTKEYLDVPAEFVSKGNLLGGKIVTISGNPVIDFCHSITDKTNFFFRLIDILGSQQNYGVVEKNTTGWEIIFSDLGPFFLIRAEKNDSLNLNPSADSKTSLKI